MAPPPMLSTRTLTRTLWVRQQLVPGLRDVQGTTALVEHLLGLQAQDNLPPYLSIAARSDTFAPADLSDRIEDRTLVRFFTMRGTVHVLTAADALQLRGWVQPALDRQSATNQTSRPARHQHRRPRAGGRPVRRRRLPAARRDRPGTGAGLPGRPRRGAAARRP